MPPILSFLRRIGILPRVRVLFFFHETTWSGAPIQLWHVVRALQDRGPFAIMLQQVGSLVMRKPAAGLEQGPLSDRTVYANLTKA